MSQKFLYVFRLCAVREQVTCERVSECVKMEVLKPRNLFLRCPAHKADRVCRFISPVRTEAYKGEFLAKIGMTIEEAAEMSGNGRNTMRALVDWGKLPVLKVGRKTITRTDTLERFMTVNQGKNLRCRDEVKEVV